VRQSLLDFVEVDGELIERDAQWVAMIFLVCGCSLVDQLSKFTKGRFADDTLPFFAWCQRVAPGERP
jgi:hypothetical protein